MFRVGDLVLIKGTPIGLSERSCTVGRIGKIIEDRGNRNPLVRHRGEGDYMETWFYKKQDLGCIHTEIFKAIKRHETVL